MSTTTDPPRTGAYLLRKAPNAPATPVATKAATANPRTAPRMRRGLVMARPYFIVTHATIVIAMGPSHDTCSFHSMPTLCHSDVLPLDSSSRRGYSARSVAPAGGTARYHGYTT